MGCSVFASPYEQVKPNAPSSPPTQPPTFLYLLSQLRHQLQNNRIYDTFLSSSYISDILHEYDKCYINHQSTVLILDLVLDYMQFCVPAASATVKFQKGNFTNRMADRWLKIRNEIFFNNKDALRVLDYICRKQAGEGSEYGHCYLDLLYDFSQEETGKVAAAVKEQCKLDLRAFCLLSNYLLKCCLKLEEKGESIVQIEHKLVERLNWLKQIHPPAPPLKQSQQSFSMHQNISTPLLNLSLPTLDLQSVPPNQRQAALQTFISSAAQSATQRYGQFCDLVKDICMKEGYHFRANVKIKNMKQLKAVQRVKEKLLDTNFKKYELATHVGLNPNSKLTHFTQTEFENYRNQITQMYNSLDKPIFFKVTDMLRGKCMFSGVDKINQCCTELKKAIEDKGYRLVEIDNRLRGKTGTSDLVLKILIGDTIAQMQLVIDLNVASYEFSHKIFELVRSKFFTPLTTLQYFNDELSNDYLQELEAIIIQNNSASHHIDYGEKTTFKKGQQFFKELIKVIPFEINLKETHPNEIEVGLLADQIGRFNRIVKVRMDSDLEGVSCEQKLKNDGKYKHKMSEYGEAEKKTQAYCEEFKQRHTQLLETAYKGDKIDDLPLLLNYCEAVFLLGKINVDIGSFEKATPYYQQYIKLTKSSGLKEDDQKIIDAQKALAWIAYKRGNYEESIEIYNRCLKLQEKANGQEHISCAQTLNSIGLVYSDQAKYVQALQYYERCLAIKEKVTGKESLDLASTLNNIGLINNKLGKYKEAIRYYQRCLDIKEKIKGKDNIDCASILNNIGLLEQKLLKYSLALQHYQRCLEIREKVKGKDHIDVTLVLNNIGLIHFYSGNLGLALSCYERCLKIKEAVRGKDSIDCAPTINNIGEIYKDRGCYEIGKQYLDRSLKIIESSKGTDSISSVYALNGLGDWHRSRSEWQTALSYYKSALNIQDKVLGKESNSRISTLNSIAQIYLNTAKIQEALDICQTSLSSLKAQNNTENLDYISCLTILSRAYLSTGSLQQSLKFAKEVKEICEKANLKYFHYANALTVLADISKAQGDAQTATRNYEEALGIFEKSSYERYTQTAEKLQKCYVAAAMGEKLDSLRMRTKVVFQQQCLPPE